jgi:small GTP-binding protein
MAELNPAPARVVLLGNHQVGKSSILVRYQESEWDVTLSPTIGLAFIQRTVTGPTGALTLQIWDTPGQDRYASECALCCREAACCVIVYDVTKADTYTAMADHIKRYRAVCQDPVVFIAGNKVDLLGPDQREREVEKLVEYEAMTHHKWFLTSAKTGEQIDDLFSEISRELLARGRPVPKPTLQLIAYDRKEDKNRRRCC